MRFEDVTQDGRVLLEALPNALEPTFWKGAVPQDRSLRALMKQGILPIITRFVLEGTAGPFSADALFEAHGHYRVAVAGAGEDARLMLEMRAELTAPLGRLRDRASSQGERAVAGRIYAEHVFTRPFAPPGERRVTAASLAGELASAIQATCPLPPDPASIAALPPGATPLEPAPSPDPLPFTFGLCHTDGNLHVNSLAYLRIFEEAAIRRMVALGKGALLLGRRLEIAYRKPCFAGQTVRVVQQAFELGGRLGVAAALVDEESVRDATALARPATFARLLLEP
jgi:hypothetical protein